MANIQKQIDAMAQYFRDVSAAPGARRQSLTIEHFVTMLDGSPAEYEPLADVLRSVQGADEPLGRGDSLYTGFRSTDYAVRIGAGCQLSVAVSPCAGVVQAMTIYEAVYARLCAALAAHGMRAYTVGTHPTRRAELVPLVPQLRFMTMDRYFRNTGSQGGMMLRATAATVVTVQYTGKQDFIRKFRAASLIAPLLSLLTDNAPVYQGAANRGYCIHNHIWNNVDLDRCGIYPGVMDEGFGFSAYAASILQLPLIVARHGVRMVGVGRKSASEVYPSVLGQSEIEHILSMFYYDVGLKPGGIELRIADSMPPRYAASYAQLIKTLFASPAAQEGILRRYSGAGAVEIEAAKVGVCCNGYQAQVYGRAVSGEIAWLLAQAKSHAAAPEERRLLEPLADLAAKRKTLRETLSR